MSYITITMREFNCLNCGKLFTGMLYQSRCLYCSNKCQQDYQYNQRIYNWKLYDIQIGLNTTKRYLREKLNACWKCNVSEWNNEPITLELEHIDGNSTNNREDNLSLLCPNCHSQTETYKSKNNGNGRQSRRSRYKEGKSY
jgi:Zn finger protein HypA/HybF involved in hydrogenase expression